MGSVRRARRAAGMVGLVGAVLVAVLGAGGPAAADDGRTNLWIGAKSAAVSQALDTSTGGKADSRADSFPGAIVATAPRGTVFTGLPADAADNCAVAVDGQPDFDQPVVPGHRSYWCGLSKVRVGETQSFAFQLRIDQRNIGTDGTVVVQPGTVATDPDTSNNTAALTVLYHR
jgi:hypothetical protein